MNKREEGARIQLVKFHPVDIKTLLIHSGFDNARALSQSPTCKLSYESIRRAVQGELISTWTMFLVLDALGLPRQTVKQKMKKAGDTVLTPYFDNDKDIDPCNEAAMELFNKVMLGISDHDKDLLLFVMENIAAKKGQDVKAELEKVTLVCDYKVK